VTIGDLEGRDHRAPGPADLSPAALGAPSREEFSRTRLDLERWKGGDEEAFQSLWSRYRPALEHIVRRKIAGVRDPLLRRKVESEDVVEALTVTILKNLKDFDYLGPGSLHAWMDRIAENGIRDSLDRWRAEKRDPHAERPLEGGGRVGDSVPGFERRAPGPGPATQAALDERRHAVASAVASLSDRHHRIVVLHFYLGAEWEEVARETGAPSGEAVRKEFALKIAPALAPLLRRAS
jgi:RNA polymerase sigma factor (sigma-70 family)